MLVGEAELYFHKFEKEFFYESLKWIDHCCTLGTRSQEEHMGDRFMGVLPDHDVNTAYTGAQLSSMSKSAMKTLMSTEKDYKTVVDVLCAIRRNLKEVN